MEIIILLSFVVVGILAGLLGGLLGLSGGVITVPCLTLLFHFLPIPQNILMHMAIGTSLAAMVFNGIASTIAHHLHKGVMWDIVTLMLPGILVGCLLGAFIAHFISGIFLQILFGIFISCLGAYVLLRKKRKVDGTKRPDKTVYTWIAMGIGTLSSLLGIGGGVFSVPLLISHHYAEKKAVGTSAAISFLITTMAALAYLYFGMKAVEAPWSLGYIYLPAFAIIGVAAVIFAPLGAKWAHIMKGGLLRKIFAGTLVIIGIFMIFN